MGYKDRNVVDTLSLQGARSPSKFSAHTEPWAAVLCRRVHLLLRREGRRLRIVGAASIVELVMQMRKKSPKRQVKASWAMTDCQQGGPTRTGRATLSIAGDWPQSAGSDDRRHILALLTRARAAVHIPRHRCRVATGRSLQRSGAPGDDPDDQGSQCVSSELDLCAYQRGVTRDLSQSKCHGLYLSLYETWARVNHITARLNSTATGYFVRRLLLGQNNGRSPSSSGRARLPACPRGVCAWRCALRARRERRATGCHGLEFDRDRGSHVVRPSRTVLRPTCGLVSCDLSTEAVLGR